MANGVRGARNAREVIPWLVGRQALCSSSEWIQWGLYRGANQPCPTIACLIKGQERRALSANDWGENKTHPVFHWHGCEKAYSVQIFFPESRRIFFLKKSMFHAVFVWKGIAAHAGGGQRAPEKSISGAEMYSGIQAWGNMLVQTQHTPSSSNTHSRACISKSRVSRIQVTVTPVMVPKVKH